MLSCRCNASTAVPGGHVKPLGSARRAAARPGRLPTARQPLAGAPALQSCTGCAAWRSLQTCCVSGASSRGDSWPSTGQRVPAPGASMRAAGASSQSLQSAVCSSGGWLPCRALPGACQGAIGATAGARQARMAGTLGPGNARMDPSPRSWLWYPGWRAYISPQLSAQLLP